MTSLHRMTALSALAAALAGAAWAVRRVVVEGESMAPRLLPGDRLVVLRTGRRPRPGDVVAVRDPRMPERVLVKRVAAAPGGALTVAGAVLHAQRGYIVLGDNLPASTDSRVFGAVAPGLVLGRCVWRYAPEARRGRL